MISEIAKVGIDTPADTAMIDITESLRETVHNSPVVKGVVWVTTLHTTTGITVNEGLPDVEADLIAMLRRLAPTESSDYLHARWLPSDGAMAINSATHQRAAILGPQVAFPIDAGEIVLGSRQRVYFVELDGPLRRNYLTHILGE
ncbi:MAG: secondary thiamine-phosphate synthase enzyme YjbQ [Propionibacteriaceae bacterium]|nr:secondary thiamine-phosphate synthase enzyme YjbQ [Propionibacteriaceae bacterium]